MKDYIFGCILVSLIAGIALHLSHFSLREPTRVALGVVTLLFAASPFLYIAGGSFDFRIPEYDLSYGWAEDNLSSVTEDAYLRGVALALAERYREDASSFIVACDGFSSEDMSVSRLYVTLVGRGAFLDYREIRDYLYENLEIGECRVNVEGG